MRKWITCSNCLKFILCGWNSCELKCGYLWIVERERDKVSEWRVNRKDLMEFYLCALINTIVYGSPHELGQFNVFYTLFLVFSRKVIWWCVWSSDVLVCLCLSLAIMPLDNGYKINSIRSLTQPTTGNFPLFRIYEHTLEQWNLIKQSKWEQKKKEKSWHSF